MDELESLINKAEHLEQQQADEQKINTPDKENKQVVIAGVSPEQAAANMAESVLMVGFSVCSFFDSRIQVGEDEKSKGRESLAPVIQKYNLAMGGTGRLPWHEEIIAGIYLGGLIKRIRRAFLTLRAHDKAVREAKQQANNNQNQADYYGEARKHQSQEQSQPVSGEVGSGQEPSINPNERFL